MVTSVGWGVSIHTENSLFNLYLSIFWSLQFPLSLIGFYTLATQGELRRSEFSDSIKQKVIFVIPSVCRGYTLPAFKRVIDSILREAPKQLQDFRVDVVTDEGSCTDELHSLSRTGKIRVVVVPKAYVTQKRSRFKARAAQYALERRRIDHENLKDVFIYHLDDDTHVGGDTIASIAQFISENRDRYYLAQGVLTFPFELSPSTVSRLADSLRPSDDLTRFRFFTGLVKSPMIGLHGEHLLIRADIEDEIGWDFGDTVVEDAFFALRFSKEYPGRAVFLNSYSYGSSPMSIRDLLRQRRRWVKGLLGLAFSRDFPFVNRLPLLLASIEWITHLFTYVGFVLIVAYLVNGGNTSPVFYWLLFVWTFNFTYTAWSYLKGVTVNVSVSSNHPRLRVYQFLAFVGMYLFAFLESVGSFLGLIDFLSRRKGFDVISKLR